MASGPLDLIVVVVAVATIVVMQWQFASQQLGRSFTCELSRAQLCLLERAENAPTTNVSHAFDDDDDCDHFERTSGSDCQTALSQAQRNGASTNRLR